MTMGIQRDMHLARMLGNWMGRIIEEREADHHNAALVEVLWNVHDKASGVDRSEQFVNIAVSDDPVHKDVWDTLGWQIKRDIAEKFGRENFFPVKRDMINDALGYRAASITDAWTGTSRWDPKTQKAFRDLATVMMGKDAMKRLAQGERGLQDGVSWAKTTIVVRSLVVIRDNLFSNMLHLGMHGIDPFTGARKMRDKYLETTRYVNNLEEILKLRTDLTADRDDPLKARELRARIQALIDANARMSIAPLIKSGELTTVSEGLDNEDVAIREGGFGQLIEDAVDKLPGGVKTVGANVLITKETALFKALNRMVQYGDFVSKAVLYDHLRIRPERRRQTIDVFGRIAAPLPSGRAERDDVAAAHEGDGPFDFDGLDRRVCRILVGPEPLVPDVAGSFVVDDLEAPGLVGFQAVNLHREGTAVDDDPPALARDDQVRFVFGHSAELPRSGRGPDYGVRRGAVNLQDPAKRTSKTAVRRSEPIRAVGDGGEGAGRALRSAGEPPPPRRAHGRAAWPPSRLFRSHAGTNAPRGLSGPLRGPSAVFRDLVDAARLRAPAEAVDGHVPRSARVPDMDRICGSEPGGAMPSRSPVPAGTKLPGSA